MFSRIKQKLSKNCHPYNTRIRSGYISYERQLEWWDEQNQPTYDNVKTKRLEKSTGTPFKRCSSSQPRSRPGLRFRLTPLLLLIERVWWISHSLITSSAFDIWHSTFHTPVVEKLQARALFVKQYSQPDFQAVSCNNSSSVFLNHYRTIRTKQRRGSQASGFRKQCHEGKTSSHLRTPLVYFQQHLQ